MYFPHRRALNSAEAAAHLNKLPEARTRLLKLIENRYTSEGYEQKKNEINAMSQEKLVTEILKERARELAFEGHRWFDLRRTTRPQCVTGIILYKMIPVTHCVFHKMQLMLIPDF